MQVSLAFASVYRIGDQTISFSCHSFCRNSFVQQGYASCPSESFTFVLARWSVLPAGGEPEQSAPRRQLLLDNIICLPCPASHHEMSVLSSRQTWIISSHIILEQHCGITWVRRKPWRSLVQSPVQQGL